MHHHQHGHIFGDPSQVKFQHLGIEEIFDLRHDRKRLHSFLLPCLLVVGRPTIDRQRADNADNGPLNMAQAVDDFRNIIF